MGLLEDVIEAEHSEQRYLDRSEFDEGFHAREHAPVRAELAMHALPRAPQVKFAGRQSEVNRDSARTPDPPAHTDGFVTAK